MCELPTSLSTTTRIEDDSPSIARHLCIVAVVAAAFLTPRALIGPLRHWDEAWYAQVSREMLEESSWMTVRWNDAPWFHKPPLTFWATAAIYQMFGTSEFTARLFSLVCGVALVVVVAAFSQQWLGTPHGVIAPLILLSIPEFDRYAARGQIDVPITLWISLHLISFWLGRERPGWFLVGGVAFGLGILTKGAAAGLGLVVQLVYGILSGDRQFLRSPNWWGGLGLGAMIALPWHIHQITVHGWDFLREYGSRHLTQFFVDIYPETASPGAPATYYLDFLWRKDAPWGWVILAVLVAIVVRAVYRRGDWRFVFVACWAATIPIVLSMAWAKWSWYLLPMYPAIALGGTLLIRECFQGKQAPRWIIAVLFLTAASVATEPFWTPPSKNHENEIRELGPRIAQHLPPGGRVVTLQNASARESIYPIAVRFYGERTVQAVEGEERFVELCARAANVVFAVIHAQVLDRLRLAADGRDGSMGDIEFHEVARSGDVVFVQAAPRRLFSPSQAARKSASSRATR